MEWKGGLKQIDEEKGGDKKKKTYCGFFFLFFFVELRLVFVSVLYIFFADNNSIYEILIQSMALSWGCLCLHINQSHQV